MNDQTLDAAAAIPFRDALLIPIKADLVKLFGTNKIQFQISIKDNKIIIESPKILANLDNQDRQLQAEAITIARV